ncbi:hypothetical protein PR202_ga15664 [Eleusine coracana subsp. coracana]|uniref:Trypsin-like peptidase domain-containing protein n=1 Tax=Eleusine coracana subsp. coracana TaxID=191504 RepID=A0AAV5CKQ9_ELECO|nr:hypothetical protein PR202_ga15664 [Eleusine coracana subsp. coracana]
MAPSKFETASRNALAYRGATVSILQGEIDGSRKEILGTGFIIRRDSGGCFVMTCHHVIKEYYKKYRHVYTLWLRLHGADQDLRGRVRYRDRDRDLAVIRIRNLPQGLVPTPLKFSFRKNIGKIVVLLGYFNPPQREDLLNEEEVISHDPASVPGVIV